MSRRTTILVAVIAAVVALAAMPALAEKAGIAARQEWRYPPAWTDQTVTELRDRVAERPEAAEERIANSPRLTEDQKAAALENLEEALDAIATVDEPAEILGTGVSRRQLQRIEWRAIRNGETPDYERHIARDLGGSRLWLGHLTTIATWAEVAGRDITAVTEYLDDASVLLEVADADGTVEERHDAIHIARMWMTKAHVILFAM